MWPTSVSKRLVGAPFALRFATRRDAGSMEGFAGVDVADPHHGFLVQQREFDRRSPTFEALCEVDRAPRVKGLGAEVDEKRVGRFLGARKQIDDTKASRVGVDRPRTVGENELQVVVFAPKPRLVSKSGDGHAAVHGCQQWLGGGVGFVGIKQRVPTRHAQMGEQDAAVIKVEQEVLRSATNVRDGATRNGWKVFGKGVPQAAPPNEHVLNGPSLNPTNQTLAHRFDLGQLRHGLHLRNARRTGGGGLRSR